MGSRGAGDRRLTTLAKPEPASLWRGRIPGLDGVRALSFLLVFVSHLGFMGSRPGGFAVSVFFLLSGYLIASLLIGEHLRTGTISLRQFYIRRTLRIFPAMYAALIACWVLTSLHVLRGPLRLGAAVLNLLYLQNYTRWVMLVKGVDGSYIPGTGQFWSLCIEEHFYLLFPLLLLLLLRRGLSFRRISLVLLGLCVLALVWRMLVVRSFPLPKTYTYMATDCRLDSILWGCLLATVENYAPWRECLTYRRLLLATPLALAALLATFVFHDTGQMTFRYTVQGVALTPLLYLVTHYPDRLLTRPLNHPVLVHLGTLSYALYLVHSAVIEIVRPHLRGGRLIVWPVCGLASYLVALALQRLVERPFLALRDRHRVARGTQAEAVWGRSGEPVEVPAET